MFPSWLLYTVLTLALLPPLLQSTTTLTTELHRYRRLLHQPLFPLDQSLSPSPFSSPSPQSQPQPQPQPKYPFSSQTPPTTTQPHNPFFPLDISPPLPPPPPPHSATHFATFPANISSLILPPSHSNSHPVSIKLIAVIVSLTLLSATLIAATSAAVFHHSQKHHHLPLHFKKEFHPLTDNLRLVPPNTSSSDAKIPANVSKKPPPPPAPPLLNQYTTSTSSEFLYLGTLFRSAEFTDLTSTTAAATNTAGTTTNSSATYINSAGATTVSGDITGAGDTEQTNATTYQRIDSPELRPLPPLPRQQFGKYTKNDEMGSEEDEEFFSPRGSSSDYKDIHSPQKNALSSHYNLVDLDIKFDAKKTNIHDTNLISPMSGNANFTPPTPPPPPPLGFLDRATVGLCPSGVGVSSRGGVLSDERPKLKPLHWDKVRASSDRSMVWDQLKASSFEVNEEMIETLFMVNSSKENSKDGNWKPVAVARKQDNRVLDPKKSQNIAILLKALNVTTEEVCEALLEGDADTLGTELLESLIKMSPTKEEARKLLEYKDDSSAKLGPPEKFLKAVLEIPFAFKRIDAVLYMTNFDSEVEYLKSSFETLETACKELKNSRMLMKLLEAVLRTGNRMNVGTNRGDAHAFKLDTLLKLVDIKGTDGKTTLLHFVVHEIIRAEGSEMSCADQKSNGDQNVQSFLRDDVEFRKIGIQVVSGLSVELSNVKKAASMDSDLLRNEVTGLVNGITKVAEVLNLNEQLDPRAENPRKFSESMNEFLKKSKEEIINIQVQEGLALSAVKEITKYFHGDSAKEEAHRFRIFVVVRDFLSTLDQVCRDVSKINDRTTVSQSREKAVATNPSLSPFFPGLYPSKDQSTSDDDSSSPSSPR